MEGGSASGYIPPGGEAAKSGMVQSALTLEQGFIVVPEAPGLGVEVVEDAEQRFPYRPRAVRTRLHVDGSVVDQ